MTFPGRAKVAPDFTDLREMKGTKVRLVRNSSETSAQLKWHHMNRQKGLYTAIPDMLLIGDHSPVRAIPGAKTGVLIHLETLLSPMLLTPKLIYPPKPRTRLSSITLPFGHSIVLGLDCFASWQS